MFERYKYRRQYKKNQQVDKKRLRDHNKVMQRKYRKERRRALFYKILSFLSNPFANRELNPEQQLRKEINIQFKRERKELRKKWIQDFRQNPIKTILKRGKNETLLQLEQWKKIDKKIATKNRIRSFQFAFIEAIKSKELRLKYSLTILQSGTYFILSFLLLYVCYQAITIIVAYFFNIPTVWYYYRVQFPLYVGSYLYSRGALISIFASGPVLSLGLAFLFLKLFFNRKFNNHGLKLFFLWGFINGANFFFGSYVVGFITRTEFIYSTEWLFMSSMFDVEEIIFTVIAITICLLIGRLVTPLFLLTAGSGKIIEPRFRLFFILNQVLFPWLIGIVVFYLLTTPEHYIPLIFKTITPIFILLPTLFTYNSLRNENIHVAGIVRKNYFRWSIVILVMAILFFYRILLDVGLKLF